MYSIKSHFTPRTVKSERLNMEDGIFPFSDLMVQLSWSDSLQIQFTKPLGSSIGVNQMSTKGNDHAPKSECAEILILYAQK